MDSQVSPLSFEPMPEVEEPDPFPEDLDEPDDPELLDLDEPEEPEPIVFDDPDELDPDDLDEPDDELSALSESSASFTIAPSPSSAFKIGISPSSLLAVGASLLFSESEVFCFEEVSFCPDAAVADCEGAELSAVAPLASSFLSEPHPHNTDAANTINNNIADNFFKA